jgi:hypothetical protein
VDRTTARPAVSRTGVLGGFTTFSTLRRRHRSAKYNARSRNCHGLLWVRSSPHRRRVSSARRLVGCLAAEDESREVMAEAGKVVRWRVAVTVLLVAVGAAIGAPLRYLTDRTLQRQHDSVFPWGTFASTSSARCSDSCSVVRAHGVS